MADAWIVDLRHYLAPTGAIAEMSRPARNLAAYFTRIVVDATTNIDEPPTVRCRRYPRHRRCVGIVISSPVPDENDAIHWHCPVCHDSGIITGWRNTLWDGFAEQDSLVS